MFSTGNLNWSHTHKNRFSNLRRTFLSSHFTLSEKLTPYGYTFSIVSFQSPSKGVDTIHGAKSKNNRNNTLLQRRKEITQMVGSKITCHFVDILSYEVASFISLAGFLEVSSPSRLCKLLFIIEYGN